MVEGVGEDQYEISNLYFGILFPGKQSVHFYSVAIHIQFQNYEFKNGFLSMKM